MRFRFLKLSGYIDITFEILITDGSFKCRSAFHTYLGYDKFVNAYYNGFTKSNGKLRVWLCLAFDFFVLALFLQKISHQPLSVYQALEWYELELAHDVTETLYHLHISFKKDALYFV